MHKGERVTAAMLTVHSVVRREVVAAGFVLTTGRFRVLNIHPSHEDTSAAECGSHPPGSRSTSAEHWWQSDT